MPRVNSTSNRIATLFAPAKLLRNLIILLIVVSVLAGAYVFFKQNQSSASTTVAKYSFNSKGVSHAAGYAAKDPKNKNTSVWAGDNTSIKIAGNSVPIWQTSKKVLPSNSTYLVCFDYRYVPGDGSKGVDHAYFTTREDAVDSNSVRENTNQAYYADGGTKYTSKCLGQHIPKNANKGNNFISPAVYFDAGPGGKDKIFIRNVTVKKLGKKDTLIYRGSTASKTQINQLIP